MEETEAMFEDPNGIKYLGTPAWKTKVVTKLVDRAEHGDVEAKRAVEYKLSDAHEHDVEKAATPPAAA